MGSSGSSGINSSGNNWCAAPTSTNYVVGSQFAGFAFAFISLSQTYGDNLPCAWGTNNDLCLAGQLESRIVGAVGFNFNQFSVADSLANSLPEMVNSVTVSFTNAGGSALRLQINQDRTYFCYDIGPQYFEEKTNTVTINASEFITNCWDGRKPLGWRGGHVGRHGCHRHPTDCAQQSLPRDYRI